MSHTFQGPIKQTRTERNFWKHWDRQCGKTVHIDHGKESLKRAVVAELREFPG